MLKYFATFTGYEDDIFEVISNFHVQEFKFGGNIYKFRKKKKKKKKKVNFAEFREFVFSKSGQPLINVSNKWYSTRWR